MLKWIEYFSERGHKSSRIHEINKAFVSNRRHMKYEYHNKHPMQMVELKLKMIFYGNLHLINALDRCIKNFLFRE